VAPDAEEQEDEPRVRMLGRLLGYVRPYWWGSLLSVILIFVLNSAKLAPAWFIKLIIDQSIPARDLGQATLYLEFHDWAGMLAGTRLEVFRHWWLPVAPAGAFSIAIVGFHLLGDGLRAVLEPANQHARPALFRALAASWARARVRRPVGAQTRLT
jgi:ABC-type multidrug transport system fused ATPase/permease subunit